jgi:hypothetical protein
MHPELLNLWLFSRTIVKVALMTSLGPFVLCAWLRSMGAKFWCPLTIGNRYRVEGYHTGDFVGEVERANRDIALVRVTDPMRPMPRVLNRCCFPECIREDFHFGDHEFVRVREGVLLEVSWRAARFVPILLEQVSGSGQLASNVMPLKNRATSPPRKMRRRA